MQKYLNSSIISENLLKANKKERRTIAKDVIKLFSLQTD